MQILTLLTHEIHFVSSLKTEPSPNGETFRIKDNISATKCAVFRGFTEFFLFLGSHFDHSWIFLMCLRFKRLFNVFSNSQPVHQRRHVTTTTSRKENNLEWPNHSCFYRRLRCLFVSRQINMRRLLLYSDYRIQRHFNSILYLSIYRYITQKIRIFHEIRPHDSM